MKLKKVTLLVILALIIGMTIAGKTYASTSMELGIISLREGGYGYSAGTKNVWKIVEYQNGKYNYNNAIYCLRGGPGFGNSSYIENRIYNVSYNLKEYSTIPNGIKGILPSDQTQTYTSGGQTYTYTNYNAVLVLLDNLYLPKDANAASFKQQLIKAAFPTLAPEDFALTDDDIEVVQQCALWYFTNSDPSNASQYAYHFETLPALQLTRTEGGIGPFNMTLDDLDPTWSRQTQASQLYNFLINLAKKSASSYGYGDTRSIDVAPAEVVNTNVTSEIVNGRIIAGPFRVENSGDTNYDVSAEVKDQNDNSLQFTILDENKQPLTLGTTLKSLANKDFYISVADNINISKVKVNINIEHLVTVPTFYTVGGSELIEQPVVIVTRTEKEEQKEVEVPVIRKEFDLSLRKFITSVNGVAPTVNRTPVLNTTNLENGADTTATYTQPKDSVEVNPGDTVLYTIRVYNEGELDGKAMEVIDYLPSGLALKTGSTINNTYGWVQSGQKITTTYLANQTAIPAFDKTKTTAGSVLNWQKSATGSSGLYYADVQVECTVTAEKTAQSQTLRNIAEITADNSSTYGVTDRDSTPKDVDINNYNPPSNNSKYQEDDDDYEQIIIPAEIIIPKEFDLSLRKFITSVNGIEPTTDRAPIVDATNLINGTATTATYMQSKDPIFVVNNDIVVYTIRIYNEGNVPGFAEEVKDDVPAGLTFLLDNEINQAYRWQLDENGNIRTDYLSKAQGEQNQIPAFDPTTMTTPAYKDVQVAFKVDESAISKEDREYRIVINTAEISKDYNDYNIPDRDSTPDNGVPGEDDIDKEYIKVGYFDLALLKWVSNAYVTVDGKTTNIQGNSTSNKPDQDPVLKVDVDKKKINTTNITFVYTIQVINQGEIAGYAKEVKDRIPEGLEFVPSDNPLWHLDADGNVVTEQLADTLLQPGDTASVQIAFRWIKNQDNFGLKTNVAEISKDYNDSNTPDIDSTPDNNVPEEDDQDEASVIISIKTGDVPIYLGLITASMATLGGGVYFIRKFVL